MRVEELRIGNLVSVKEEELKPILDDYGLHGVENSFNVVSIDNVHLNVLIDGLECEYYLSDLEPIPLTDDWLKRFGFEETTDKGFILYYELSSGAYLEKVGEVLRLFDRGGYMLSHDNLKHVHQLQNLYHALTGEELTIKNK